MEKYLTTQELSDQIKMAPGTIRNLVWKKELKKDVHYIKPTGRKLLFIWSSVEEWLFRKTDHHSFNRAKPENKHKSRFNIF